MFIRDENYNIYSQYRMAFNPHTHIIHTNFTHFNEILYSQNMENVIQFSINSIPSPPRPPLSHKNTFYFC